SEFTRQPLSIEITLKPAFCASMAQARPVGPEPMTTTSARISGRGSSCGFGKVSGMFFVGKTSPGMLEWCREILILACRDLGAAGDEPAWRRSLHGAADTP